MKTISKSTYSLKRFSSSNDDGFAEAILLYIRHIPAAIRTNTNEITYWVDNQKDYIDNQLFFCGFYCNNKLIGFTEMAYLNDSKVVIIDYFVIEQEFRKNNVYFEFVDHIKSLISNLILDVRYIVAEVGGLDDCDSPKGNKILVRLLKLSGFKVAKTTYYQPQLGDKNEESKMDAILMVWPYGHLEDDNREFQINKKTYLQIVDAIYMEHYLRWYTPHSKNIDIYKADLKFLIEKIKSSIDKDFIVLNGSHLLLTSGKKTTEEPKKTHLTAGIGLTFVLASVVLLVFIMRYGQISFEVLVGVCLMSLLAYIGIMASIGGSSIEVFKEINQLIKKIFRI